MKFSLMVLGALLFACVIQAQDRPPHPFLENPAIQDITSDEELDEKSVLQY